MIGESCGQASLRWGPRLVAGPWECLGGQLSRLANVVPGKGGLRLLMLA